MDQSNSLTGLVGRILTEGPYYNLLTRNLSPEHLFRQKEMAEKVLLALSTVDRKKFIPPGIPGAVITIPLEDFNGLMMAAQEIIDEYGGFESVRKMILAKTQISGEMGKILDSVFSLAFSKRIAYHDSRDFAYNDFPVGIGYGQTCSQPSLVALMASELDLQPGMKVLEVGSGCLYHAAIVEKLVGERGNIYSVEIVPQLAELARKNNRRYCRGRIEVAEGDGSAGLPYHAPFDRIYFTAGISRKGDLFDPAILRNQLKPGGILLVPEASGDLLRYRQNPAKPVFDEPEIVLKNVAFVPLVGREKREERITILSQR